MWGQWSNNAITGTLATDGLRIGIRGNVGSIVGGTAEIRQNENQPLNVYTNYSGSTTGSLTIGANKQTGIGDFVSTVTAPARRLEVYDSGSNPQFRITKTLGSVYTDIKTDGSGYLTVNPTGRFTGFDVSTAPGNVVDVNSTSTSVSGLRLRNLSAVTTPGSGKVLSINGSGDVILVNAVNDDLLAMINEFKTEIKLLKEQINLLAKN